jgi:predicted RNA-binding Zn-ribbon protein involved in translation (DUF1610 family)
MSKKIQTNAHCHECGKAIFVPYKDFEPADTKYSCLKCGFFSRQVPKEEVDAQ